MARTKRTRRTLRMPREPLRFRHGHAWDHADPTADGRTDGPSGALDGMVRPMPRLDRSWVAR